MVLETRDMLSCTGRFLVRLYSTNPNKAPITQITRPAIRMLVPLMLPSSGNVTSSFGSLRSASPAETVPEASQSMTGASRV